jgi:hypothetical protein
MPVDVSPPQRIPWMANRTTDHHDLDLILWPKSIFLRCCEGSHMVTGSDYIGDAPTCCSSWSKAVLDSVSNISKGIIIHHNGTHCQHAGILSLFINTNIIMDATIMLCIEDNFGHVWMDLHLEHQHSIMLLCFHLFHYACVHTVVC